MSKGKAFLTGGSGFTGGALAAHLQADGYEVTARLKQLPGLSRIPIIAVTANVMKGDREKTLAAGCDGYIQKPIDIDLLPGQIERFLKKD